MVMSQGMQHEVTHKTKFINLINCLSDLNNILLGNII